MRCNAMRCGWEYQDVETADPLAQFLFPAALGLAAPLRKLPAIDALWIYGTRKSHGRTVWAANGQHYHLEVNFRMDCTVHEHDATTDDRIHPASSIVRHELSCLCVCRMRAIQYGRCSALDVGMESGN
jgi:hypothetical protein